MTSKGPCLPRLPWWEQNRETTSLCLGQIPRPSAPQLSSSPAKSGLTLVSVWKPPLVPCSPS